MWIPISLSGFACGGGGGLLLLLPRRPRLIFCQMGSADKGRKRFQEMQVSPVVSTSAHESATGEILPAKNTPFLGFVSSSPSAPTFFLGYSHLRHSQLARRHPSLPLPSPIPLLKTGCGLPSSKGPTTEPGAGMHDPPKLLWVNGLSIPFLPTQPLLSLFAPRGKGGCESSLESGRHLFILRPPPFSLFIVCQTIDPGIVDSGAGQRWRNRQLFQS